MDKSNTKDSSLDKPSFKEDNVKVDNKWRDNIYESIIL